MPVTASNYDEILELSEDRTLDEATRARMKADIAEYETIRQVGGAAHQLSPSMRNSLDAMEAGGMHRPMSKADWSRQYELRKNVGPSGISKDQARQIDEGMTRAFLEDDPEGDPQDSVINWGQAPKVPELQEQFFAHNLEEFPDQPEMLNKLADAWGYTPPKSTDFVTTEGDPTAESLKRIEEQAEQEKLRLGLDAIDDGLPSASKRKNLYAPPEFIPPKSSFNELLTAQYFQEPPLELAKAALRQTLGPAADELSEEDDQYKRFADAMWKEQYEQAEKEGRPVLRIKYMNTDDWVGKAAQLSARALGSALPFAVGVDRSLTGGVATELASGAIDKASGSGERVRRGMRAATDAAPLTSAAGAVVGALAPGGLVGRTYSKTAGAIARPGVGGLGRRLAGATAGGVVTGGVASAAPDVAYNIGEKIFSDNPRYKRTRDIVGDAAVSAGTGALFGPAGELIGTGAGRAVRAVREGRRGKAIADLEQAGMSVRRTKELDEVRKRAAQEQRFPEDLLVSEIEDGMSALSRKRAEQAGVRTSADPRLPTKESLLAFRSKPGREDVDEALFSLAEDAGVAEELLLLRALKASSEIDEATRFRSIVGTKGDLSGYAGNPGEVIAFRADPLLRGLSLREPVPRATQASPRAAEISEDLLNFVRRIARPGTKRRPDRAPWVKDSDVISLPGSINPIEDIMRGARGRGSARQLGGAGPAGTDSRKEKYTLDDLSYEEQMILKRLIETLGKRGRKAASGE